MNRGSERERVRNGNDLRTLRDPRDLYPRPPFPEQPQPHPGSSAKMQPQPDYREVTYRGSGRFAGRKAIVTGAGSGIGRADVKTDIATWLGTRPCPVVTV